MCWRSSAAEHDWGPDSSADWRTENDGKRRRSERAGGRLDEALAPVDDHAPLFEQGDELIPVVAGHEGNRWPGSEQQESPQPTEGVCRKAECPGPGYLDAILESGDGNSAWSKRLAEHRREKQESDDPEKQVSRRTGPPPRIQHQGERQVPGSQYRYRKQKQHREGRERAATETTLPPAEDLAPEATTPGPVEDERALLESDRSAHVWKTRCCQFALQLCQ